MQLLLKFIEHGRLGRYPMQLNRDFFKSNVICSLVNKSYLLQLLRYRKQPNCHSAGYAPTHTEPIFPYWVEKISLYNILYTLHNVCYCCVMYTHVNKNPSA